MINKTKRSEVLPGQTYKIKAPNAQGEYTNIYLTVNEEDGKPYEVFINCSDTSLYETLAVAMILVSRLIQKGASLEEIAGDLAQVQSAYTAHMDGSQWFPSLIARIGAQLRSHESLRQGRLDLTQAGE